LQHGLEDAAARIDMLTTIGQFLDEHIGRGGWGRKALDKSVRQRLGQGDE
jgi:hypothetical protein